MALDLFIMEGEEIHPCWDKCTFWSGFVFPAGNSSSSNLIHELKKCLRHHHGIPHGAASDQGTHDIEGKHSQQVVSVELTGLTMYLEVAGLIERWNGYWRLICGANQEIMP